MWKTKMNTLQPRPPKSVKVVKTCKQVNGVFSNASVMVGILVGFSAGMYSDIFNFPCDLQDSAKELSQNDFMGQYHATQAVANSSDTEATVRDPDNVAQSLDKNLVLIGIMTAKQFVNSRAVASYHSWVKTIPGRVIFFSSEGSETLAPDYLPVVGLKGVSDEYPPQKKSFLMLKFMHKFYGDKYEWFIRADDDVFIKGDKLAAFLHSINGSKPQFMGQAGIGKTEELGLLSFQAHENFCMGGPSVAMSKATFDMVGPHIGFCLRNIYSTHEDVEIGRCVGKFAKVPCTWNWEVWNIC